jgi:hypothetical protein
MDGGSLGSSWDNSRQVLFVTMIGKDSWLIVNGGMQGLSVHVQESLVDAPIGTGFWWALVVQQVLVDFFP